MSKETNVPATRREMDILRDEVHRLDDHGSRGVGALQVQFSDLLKDVTELKVAVNNRFETHQKQPDRDEDARREGRRWLITTGIACVLAMATVIGLLIEVLLKVH